MLHSLHNQHLQIVVSEMGAELQSIQHLKTKREYLWSGDPAFWGKKSPVLFPIVGGLKNNQYQFQHQPYTLNRHGFARERKFQLEKSTETELVLSLQEDTQSLAQYPFQFCLVLRYSLEGPCLRCNYEVSHNNPFDLLFSIGAHPAFKVPIDATDEFEDYCLLFDQPEKAPIWPLSTEGLILNAPKPFSWENSPSGQVISLRKSLFYGDALVFKNLASTQISLVHQHQSKGLHFRFPDYPFFGIWSAKDAPFVCLEPWCGIADSINTTGELTQKEGIISLPPSESFSRHWEVEPF